MTTQEKIIDELNKKLKNKDAELETLYGVVNRLNSYVASLIDNTENGIKAAMSLNRKIATRKLPNIKDIKFSSRYLIATTDKSTYYDFFEISKSGAGLVMCDANGYGLSAVLMSIIMGLLNTNYAKSPKSFIETVIKDIEQHINSKENPYDFKTKTASMIYLYINRANMELNYCSLGMPGIILLREGKADILDGNKSDLLHSEKIDEKVLKLKNGDKIIIPNNEILNAQNSKSEKFGIEGVIRALNNSEHVPIADLINNVGFELDSFTESKRSYLSGDTAVLALEVERKGLYVV